MDNQKRKFSTLDSVVQKSKKTDDSSTNKNQFMSSVNLKHPPTSTSAFTEYGGESSRSSLGCSQHEKRETQEEEHTACTSSNVEIYIDIGKFSNVNVDEIDKFRILNCKWKPNNSFVLPYSVHKKGGKDVKYYLLEKYYRQFNWLMFS